MNVPIVQGVAVPDGGGGGSYQQQQPVYHQAGYVKPPQDHESGYGSSSGPQQHAQQPKQFKDAIWAVVFIVHLVVMVIFISGQMSNLQGGGADLSGYNGILWLAGTGTVAGIGLASVGLGIMMKCAATLIKMSLFFGIGMSLLFAAMGFMSGDLLTGIMGLFFAAISCCYAWVVWRRIPFAAANLNTALTAVRANMGLTIIAYGIMILAFVWTGVFFVGVGDILNESSSPYVLFVLLLSYYWVHQVLQNTIHVTVAGTIGTWWFVPSEASGAISTTSNKMGCWSRAITDSFCRATTYSFGSICLGSLILAIVQALRTTQQLLRDNDDCNIVVCIIDCILGCIESIIEYMNKWAYIYVGLYGFGYFEAGKNVIELFQNKGWTVVITDDLCESCLGMVSVAIGLMTGLMIMVCAVADPSLVGMDGNDNNGGGGDGEYNVAPNPASVGFIIGMITGYVFSSILMSVVASAVNTVIVCYAESPAEFQQNHPQLSNEMRATWSNEYAWFN